MWKPDVILARNTISVEKLLELKAELPIVFVSVFDPFGSGFVTEVTRPGKNLTGFTPGTHGPVWDPRRLPTWAHTALR